MEPSSFNKAFNDIIDGAMLNSNQLIVSSQKLKVIDQNIGKLKQFIISNIDRFTPEQRNTIENTLNKRLAVLEKIETMEKTSRLDLTPQKNQVKTLSQLASQVKIVVEPITTRDRSVLPSVPLKPENRRRNTSIPPPPSDQASPISNLIDESDDDIPPPPIEEFDNLSPLEENAPAVPSHAEQVLREYSKANQKIINHLHSLTALGEIHLRGILGMAQDPSEAVKNFSEVAKGERGDPIAKFNLGNCYAEGFGVQKDEKKAEQLWKEAVKLFKKNAGKDGESAFYLGLCFFEGKGVEKSISSAEEYWQQAASKAYGKAFYYLGMKCEFREDYKRNFRVYSTDGMIEKAATLGVPEAKQLIGIRNLVGTGINPHTSFERAFMNFKEAALLGDTFSLLQVAKCYRDGVGVTKDKTVAKRLVDEVAKILMVETSEDYQELMSIRDSLK